MIIYNLSIAFHNNQLSSLEKGVHLGSQFSIFNQYLGGDEDVNSGIPEFRNELGH